MDFENEYHVNVSLNESEYDFFKKTADFYELTVEQYLKTAIKSVMKVPSQIAEFCLFVNSAYEGISYEDVMKLCEASFINPMIFCWAKENNQVFKEALILVPMIV